MHMRSRPLINVKHVVEERTEELSKLLENNLLHSKSRYNGQAQNPLYRDNQL